MPTSTPPSNAAAPLSGSIIELNSILEEWSASRGSGQDPIPMLTSLCEIVERETELYYKMDPDPFDDRHPSRTNPNSALGSLLKALFRNDDFMDRLVHFYISQRDNKKLNELACRLLYDILPGLEGSIVFQETEGIVSKLYNWAENAENPLKSYAIGLLAAAMDVQDIAVNWRDHNAKLIPLLLDELKELSNLPSEIPPERKLVFLDRPFANISRSKVINGHSASEQGQGQARKRKRDGSPILAKKTNRAGGPGISSISSPVKSSLVSTDCSNSSWAEMELLTIGHFQIYPLSVEMRQRFILQYLTPLGEYQEFLSFIFEKNVLGLILHYMNLQINHDVRLAFEALKYLAALLCHKKFCMEFLKAGGVERLLAVYRPSVAATGVSMCLYFLGYSEDAMEKLCQMPSEVLSEVIRYSLWLLERSHESSRCHAMLFFGLAFSYAKFLEHFDNEDGLRKMMNVASTLDVITNPETVMENLDFENEDKVFASMQTARHVCGTLKKYFEAHLMIKAESLRQASIRNLHDSHDGATSGQRTLNASKALKLSPEEFEETMEFVLNNLPPRTRWPPVDEFVKLGGASLMLKLILISSEDGSQAAKMDTVKSALEVLTVCTLLPRAQLVLMEVIDHPNPDPDNDEQDENPGMAIILSVVDGGESRGLTPDPDLQKAALNIIVNCVGSPIRQRLPVPPILAPPPAAGSSAAVAPPSAGPPSAGPPAAGPPSGRRGPAKSGDYDILHRMWRCVRTNNGIMVLLARLTVKVPITEADSIRARACKALCGLARCATVKQIISKLPLFTRGQLEALSREPVLHDSLAQHAKFRSYASTLTQIVTGNALPRGHSDLMQMSSNREILVSPVRDMKYNKNDLLVLIYEHLLNSGLSDSASQLLREAKLTEVVSSKRLHFRRMNIGQPNMRQLPSSSSSARPPSPQPSQSAPVTPQSKTIPLNRTRDVITPVAHTSNRRPMKTVNLMEKSEQRDVLSPVVRKAVQVNSLSLDSIVKEYLGQQHSYCNVPVATCPPFDLLTPHRCAEPTLKAHAPLNITSRLSRRQVDWPHGGRQGAKLTRKYIYSKFKPLRVFREPELPGNFTCVSFSPCNEMLFVGTMSGELKVFNLNTAADEATYSCHDAEVTHCQPSKDGKLILTSSYFREPMSILWTFTDLFQQKASFKDDSYVEFGHCNDDRILGTQYSTARLYDTATGAKISTFVDPKLSNNYVKNRATLNPTDELVLNDGVLWDVRRAHPIHKFDKFNPYINGVFKPDGLEIISNSEVWDLRTFKLMHTLSALNQCQVMFNTRGDVMYGAMIVCEDMDEERDGDLQSMYGNSFKTIDATDYSNIATIDIKRSIFDMKTDNRDMYVAIVENAGDRSSMGADSVVRLYEVGRQKLDDDQDDNEPEEDVDDDEDGDSSSNSDLNDTLDDIAEIDDGDSLPEMGEESFDADFEGSSFSELSSGDEAGDSDDDSVRFRLNGSD